MMPVLLVVTFSGEAVRVLVEVAVVTVVSVDLSPSPPGGVCDLSPDGGLGSVLLMSTQQRTAHSFDRVASVWSRLVRVAPVEV